MLRLAFQGGFQFFGLLYHGHNLFILAGAVCLLDAKSNFALFHNGSGIYRHARLLGNGHGLAGKGCLIYHGLAFRYLTVKRYDIAHMHADKIARLYQIGSYLYLLSVLYKPYFSHI